MPATPGRKELSKKLNLVRDVWRNEYSLAKEHVMSSVRSPNGRSLYRFSIPLLVVVTVFSSEPVQAEEHLAGVIADGKPWEMYVVKRRVSNIFVFRPDGGGTISDGMVSLKLTWQAVSDGICVRPQPGGEEKCLQLTRTKTGIAASQNGKPVWVLKR
jgi:hypothetical protein